MFYSSLKLKLNPGQNQGPVLKLVKETKPEYLRNFLDSQVSSDGGQGGTSQSEEGGRGTGP